MQIVSLQKTKHMCHTSPKCNSRSFGALQDVATLLNRCDYRLQCSSMNFLESSDI